MSIGLRCRRDRPARELAAGMFGEGRGYKSVARSVDGKVFYRRRGKDPFQCHGNDFFLSRSKE